MAAAPAPVPVPAWLTDLPGPADGSGRPAHVRIEQWLTRTIGRGDLVPGDRLPPEDELATLVGVSRMTLRQALGTLERLGTVVRKAGRSGGTFVSEPRIECDLTGLAGFTEQMRRANVRAGARMVSAATLPASARVAAALSVRRGAAVHEVVRIRTAHRAPLALERSYFSAAQFPDLLAKRLTGSLYGLLTRDYGQTPHTATETLEAVVASDDDAALLGVESLTPLLSIERTAFTAAGLAVEFARDLFRSDRVKIALRTGITAAARTEVSL